MLPRSTSLLVIAGLTACFAAVSVAARAQATGVPAGTVVAKQGDIAVTLADIDAFARGIPEEQRPGFFNSPTRLENLIGSLLLKKQLAAEARAAQLDKDPEVAAQVALAVDDALSAARMSQFKQDLELPDFDALAKEEYVGHKEKYVVPARVDVKHILVSTKSRSVDEARALAQTVEKELKAQPGQFDAFVEKYSEDPSKATNKGLMVDAAGSKYVPAFAIAAGALKKVGDVSPIVETKFGFHILELVNRTDKKQVAFEEAKPQIVAQLRNAFIEKAVQKHTSDLRSQPLEAKPEVVASLRSRYGVEMAPPKVPAAQPGT